MDFPRDSIFQLLTTVKQILKSYQENNYEIDQIQNIFGELQQLRLSPETIFQQLIPSKDKIIELKYSLYKQVIKSTSEPSTLKFQVQNIQKLNYNSESFLNMDDSSQIQRKISAIKGEAMFINQELTIQKMQFNLNQEIVSRLAASSLRKLIKQYMKKCRSNSKLQFLIPLCIRLVVLQQSIILYLQKSLTFFCSILNHECDSSIAQQLVTNNNTIKSISSLSASIQQFLQKQNRKNPAQALNNSMEAKQCRTYEPIIRSDFILNRNNTEKLSVTANQQDRRKNCCMWF